MVKKTEPTIEPQIDTANSKVTVEMEENVKVSETVAPTVAPAKPLSSNVQIKVKVGTLKFEQGTFQKGDVITVDRVRLAQMPDYLYEVSES